MTIDSTPMKNLNEDIQTSTLNSIESRDSLNYTDVDESTEYSQWTKMHEEHDSLSSNKNTIEFTNDSQSYEFILDTTGDKTLLDQAPTFFSKAGKTIV